MEISLSEAIRVVEGSYTDRELLDLYDAGDKMSQMQTKHDVGHAFSVRDVAIALTDAYDKRFPGRLDDWTKLVVIPLAAFLHDIGRAVDVDNHAGAGARVAHEYLSKHNLPADVRRRICRIVALHRSSSVLKREFDDPAWAIVVIADKCVGDEDRVRPAQARALRILRAFGLAYRNWWKIDEHDRVNFAIKPTPQLVVDSNEEPGYHDPGAMVLKIKLDENVAPASEVTTLYGERFHACGRAAQHLGFVFRIEFNGVRFAYDKASKGWKPVHTINVPLP